jgi:SAM-dependent methyltransferase
VKLLELLKRFKPEGRLLDIGAASGILVEQARRLGFDAQGIEPCKYLQQQAADLGLPVSLNVFPYEGLESDYGVITMVDVIEHVPNPRELFEGAYDHLKAGGLLLVVTPNVRSFCATIMKWKWWHYRVAHIGYFSDKNMRMLINDTGFEVVHDSKPGWFFSLDYLVGRLNKYLPAAIQLPIPACFQKITVPLNLFDSMLFICRKRS